jgi:hypothetical protein
LDTNSFHFEGQLALLIQGNGSDDTQETQFEKTQNKTKQKCSNLRTDTKIFKDSTETKLWVNNNNNKKTH